MNHPSYLTVENLKTWNLNEILGDRMTKFYWMCYNSYQFMFTMETLKYCLEEAKCNLNFRRDDSSYTPFYWICSYYGTNGVNMEMLKYCIEKGNVDINRMEYDTTPFYTLCYKIGLSRNDELPLLKYLISIGGDVNIVCDQARYTPFTWLCKNEKYVKFLGKKKVINHNTLERALNSDEIFKLTREFYIKYFVNEIVVDENMILY